MPDKDQSLASKLSRLAIHLSESAGKDNAAAQRQSPPTIGPDAIGAVENLQGISWQRITIDGVANHAGTTPMAMRHDAGYAAIPSEAADISQVVSLRLTAARLVRTGVSRTDLRSANQSDNA